MEIINSLEEGIKSSLSNEWLDSYKHAMDLGNPHSKRFPLMNPFHAILIVVGYLVIVFLGISIMKNRKSFTLFGFSLFHNGMLVLLSGYMCFEILGQSRLNNFSLFGNGVDPTSKGLDLAKILWLFYFSKIIEFTDTYIMVLKKNNRQVSFLHVYHHVSTFLIWWAVIYYAPGGDTYFSAAQNCFIHVLMYSYYFLATLKINAPWKKYLTQAQMLQFLLNCIQAFYVLYYPTPYPKWLAVVLLVYMVTLLGLFGNFYIQSQSRSSTSPSTSPTTGKKQQ